MKQQILQNKYPIFSIEIKKTDCVLVNMKEILSFLRTKIDTHPVAQFIEYFDHFDHTNKIKNGEISTKIIDAKIVIFCFGKKLDNPLQLAVRPRSIGIAETNEKFIISFMDAPNPMFNEVMEKWIKSLIK